MRGALMFVMLGSPVAGLLSILSLQTQTPFWRLVVMQSYIIIKLTWFQFYSRCGGAPRNLWNYFCFSFAENIPPTFPNKCNGSIHTTSKCDVNSNCLDYDGASSAPYSSSGLPNPVHVLNSTMPTSYSRPPTFPSQGQHLNSGFQPILQSYHLPQPDSKCLIILNSGWCLFKSSVFVELTEQDQKLGATLN